MLDSFHTKDYRLHTPTPRLAIAQLGASKIREVANAGLSRQSTQASPQNDAAKPLLAFWFGEPASVTPDFIRQAAKKALDEGDTFYHHNLGLPKLRSALARYLSDLHSPVDSARVVVTGSGGVNALMMAAQAILDPGDEVVAVVPLWPNLTEIPAILGAKVKRISLQIKDGRWHLDLHTLLDAITAKTKAVLLNSPNNPTGWVISSNDLKTLLEHCRRIGTWIISDEAYERLVFDGSYCAPSILDIADSNDRVLVANTFSKTWQMTGWRLGWLVIPTALEESLSKIIEFNSSCAPGFIQQAACEAVLSGNEVVKTFVDSITRRQQLVCDALSRRDDITLGRPDGAMYAFFKVKGVKDSLALAKALVVEERLGLAPGAAFGAEGEGYLRWCVAKPEEQLIEGLARFNAFDFKRFKS